MPDIISFQDAIKATEGEDKALLIGNGFSAQYFNYANLLAEARLEEGSPIKALFDQLGTVDFEAVIRALENATIVERAYGNATMQLNLRPMSKKSERPSSLPSTPPIPLIGMTLYFSTKARQLS